MIIFKDTSEYKHFQCSECDFRAKSVEEVLGHKLEEHDE